MPIPIKINPELNKNAAKVFNTGAAVKSTFSLLFQ